MKQFLSSDFLLQNEFASRLYHDYAADLPIIDYHNHLPPQDIASNRKFKNITEAWLEGDHYKWRALRAFGLSEDFVTGNASNEDKFNKWAEVVPYTIRNPLYHWTHLELQRYFNITELLSPASAKSVYAQCKTALSEDENSCRGLLQKMNVESLCTTDDPIDDLNHHQEIKEQEFEIGVFPTFRPDKLYAVDSPEYPKYLLNLEESVGFEIVSYDDLLSASKARIDYFHAHGGRLSDHGFEQLYNVDYSIDSAKQTFEKARSGRLPSVKDSQVFKMIMLIELCKMYYEKGWVQQFHLGAIRNNNHRMLDLLGPDTGYDSIGDFEQISGLSKFLNILDRTDQLAKTILYNVNPRDNETFTSMAGNFMNGSIAGKIQFGSAWWFLDQKDGIEKHLDTISNMGLLSKFIGMLTDSRSFLSFPRHEYFRRILCNLIGKDVANGELPADEEHLGGIVKDICYNNAKAYFDFNN